MNKFYLLLLFVLFSVPLLAQQSAITKTGEEVTLYNDGTWVYVHKDSISSDEITTNPQRFTYDPKSTYLLKSTRLDIGCYIDTARWTFNPASATDPAEFEINDVPTGLYGLIITEKLDLPLESLANIALDNARDAAPDVKVIQKEYRTVNGMKVLMMRMTGTIQNIKFSYYGYYHTSSGGATQFLVYSSDDIVEEHIQDIESLLNGFVGTGQ